LLPGLYYHNSYCHESTSLLLPQLGTMTLFRQWNIIISKYQFHWWHFILNVQPRAWQHHKCNSGAVILITAKCQLILFLLLHIFDSLLLQRFYYHDMPLRMVVFTSLRTTFCHEIVDWVFCSMTTSWSFYGCIVLLSPAIW